ncbi:hypothetical protein B566_EDAN017963 [Ephemera danica]|nr:hypothetical protein B566_EDAN017963 [Ephemera danica]
MAFEKGNPRNLPIVTAATMFYYIEKSVQTETRGVKASRSSRDDYLDNAIGRVEIKRENSLCTVRARVSPEHRVRNTPYRVIAVINEKADNRIEEIKCLDCASSREEVMTETFRATLSQSSNAAWHHIRYGRWTASTAHETSCCKTPEGSLVEKIFGAKGITKKKKRGIDLEPRVLEVVKKIQGNEIENSGFFLVSEVPDCGGSPDGLTETAVYEVKCPSEIKTRKYYIDKCGKPQIKVLCQIQMQMFLTKKRKGYLCIASPEFESDSKVEIFEIMYDEKVVNNLIAKCRMFWRKDWLPKKSSPCKSVEVPGDLANLSKNTVGLILSPLPENLGMLCGFLGGREAYAPSCCMA